MTPLNDEFLYGLKREPDPEFARALHQRLKATSSTRHAPTRRWLSAVAVVSVIFSALILASPDVRAQISQQIERLFYGDVELRVVRSGQLSDSGSSRVPVEQVSPSDAQNIIAHQTVTWIPAGLTQNEWITLIRYSESEPYLAYTWVDANGERQVSLAIWNNAAPQMVIGQGSNSREIDINGHTGTIFRGGWNDGVWTPEGSTNLVWVMDGVTYSLGSETLSEADLLRMADSVR